VLNALLTEGLKLLRTLPIAYLVGYQITIRANLVMFDAIGNGA
jgi:hypothetical protein